MTSNADRSPAFQAPAHLGTRLPQSSSTSCRRSIVMQTPGPVFVAGGTGRVGQRVVRELAQRGVEVRLACRNPQKGQRIVEDLLPPETQSKVECVEFDVTKDENITSETLRGAETVVSALGIGENDLLKSPFGPYQIDGRGTTKLIEIARDSGVKKFVLVTSLGTGTPWKFPTVLFNLFWGLLVWKKKAEDALIDSRMNYTIIRPGGMERPKDDWKETHDTVINPPNTQYGGNVSRLQVAEVIAECVMNPEKSRNKILELTSKEKASERSEPLDLVELVEAIPAAT